MRPTKLTQEQINKARVAIEIAKRKSRGNFHWFVHNVFSASFDIGQFVRGQYIDDVCAHIQKSNYTMDVTGRDHFKSTRLYADIMWNIFTDEGKGFEAHYFSFNYDLAAYHLKKIKKMIKRNIFFSGIHDNKRTSESIIDYTWGHGENMTVTPQGLLSGKRGIHAERIYVDDPFKSEEENALIEPAQIKKINNVIISELIPMVKKGGFFRIVGTPQTPSDFFFDKGEDGMGGMQAIFDTWITPAIIDEPNKKALWPEWKSYDDLARIRSVDPIKFNKEYMAMPASSANSYIDKEKLLALCTGEQYSWAPHPELRDELVVAGFDIGKKVHPSHLAIFIKKASTNPHTQETEWRYKQIYSFWMDGWDYFKQVDYLRLAIDYFNIENLRFDNTRAEFEFAIEQNLLNPRYATPVTLGLKNESMFASYFGGLVERGQIEFVNDARQINQTLAVTNDLKSIESPQGHGDSFWSNAMAVYEDNARSVGIRVI